MISKIGAAQAALAGFDASLQNLVNPEILLGQLRTREAILSSRIEGTHATLDEVLEHEVSPKTTPEPRVNDIQEVLNYRAALQKAVQELEEIPLCLNMLRDSHKVLMQGVRGQNRAPGEFRRIQNHIGPDKNIENATYIPPPPNEIMHLLDNLEKYIHLEERDAIVQIGLVHAQFELIHPFLDGNGRVGRILIPLFLYSKKLITQPDFYLSAYLASHRDQYIDRLSAISNDGDIQGWVEFFLEALKEQAVSDIERIKAIQNLYEKTKERIVSTTRSKFALKVLDTLFTFPVFTTPLFIAQSTIPQASAARLLKLLEKERILNTLLQGRGKRPTIWSFSKLLHLVNP